MSGALLRRLLRHRLQRRSLLSGAVRGGQLTKNTEVVGTSTVPAAAATFTRGIGGGRQMFVDTLAFRTGVVKVWLAGGWKRGRVKRVEPNRRPEQQMRPEGLKGM